MFIFKNTDGLYYRESGADYISNKSRVEYWKGRGGDYYFRLLTIYASYWTSNINEAKLFKSEQAVRSSNAYSWGGSIHEVNVTISIKS